MRVNPGLTDDLVIGAFVVGGIVYLANRAATLIGQIPTPTLPSAPASVSPSNVLGSTVCDRIAFWRSQPAKGLFGTGILGSDPNDWTAFRGWMIGTFGANQDPGPNWPACWTNQAPGAVGTISGY